MSYEEELPGVGVTRNLVSSFKRKEIEAKNTPEYKPSGVGYKVCDQITTFLLCFHVFPVVSFLTDYEVILL